MTSDDRHRDVEDPLEATGVGRSIELRPGGHLGRSDPREAPVDADFPAFRRLTFFSVIGGLCPFLPGSTPQGGAWRRCAPAWLTELEHSRGLDLTPDEVRLLSTWDERAVRLPPAGSVDVAPRPLQSLQQLLPPPPPSRRAGGVQHSVETFEPGCLLLHPPAEDGGAHPPDAPRRVEEVRARSKRPSPARATSRCGRRSPHTFQKSAGLLAPRRRPAAGFLWPRRIRAGSGALTAEEGSSAASSIRSPVRLWERPRGPRQPRDGPSRRTSPPARAVGVKPHP